MKWNDIWNLIVQIKWLKYISTRGVCPARKEKREGGKSFLNFAAAAGPSIIWWTAKCSLFVLLLLLCVCDAFSKWNSPEEKKKDFLNTQIIEGPGKVSEKRSSSICIVFDFPKKNSHLLRKKCRSLFVCHAKLQKFKAQFKRYNLPYNSYKLISCSKMQKDLLSSM